VLTQLRGGTAVPVHGTLVP